MSSLLSISRRDFIWTGAAVGGGLVLGVYVPCKASVAQAAEEDSKKFAPNAFVRIGADDSVTVICNHSEMGQGVYTALPMLVAEELDADWSKVRPEPAPVDPAYNHRFFPIQMTGGSTSTWTEYDRFRKAGATGRAMLIAAAAEMWKVDPASCDAENSQVIHQGVGRKASYGSLVRSGVQANAAQGREAERSQRFQTHRQADQTARHAGKDQRQGGVWHRRELAGNVGGASRTTTGIRRQGKELQRRQGEGGARRAARGADRSGRCGGGRRLLAGQARSRGAGSRLGRWPAGDARQRSNNAKNYAELAEQARRRRGEESRRCRGGTRRRPPRRSKRSTNCRIWPTP